MNKKIMKRLMCLMVLIALAGGLIIMPVKVMATVVTPDETEQTEETEQAKSPITPTNEVMNETEDAAEGVTAETPEISGITIESDNDDEEDETKPAYTLKAKIKVSAAAKTMSDAEVVVGEQEPDGKVYVKATAYVNQGELRDAIGAGSIKISKKLESSDGTWKPTPGQNYVVAVRGYSKVYNESGQYKWGTTGYKKTYKISAAKRRAQKKREAKKRRLTLRRKNQKNRLIYQSTNYYFDEGEAYSIPELTLNGYTMTAESKAKLTGTMGSEDATVDLAYEGDEVPINIAYVDYSGDAVSEAYSSTGKVGESYSVVSPTPEGFVLANDYYGTISGTVTAGGVDKKVYYSEEKYWLVINHLDENGNELYPQADSYELKPGTEYSYDDTTSSGPIRSFDGYTLVDGDFTTEEVDNGDGTKTTKKVIKGTMPKEKKELTLRYKRNKESVKINFKHQGVNNEVAAPEGMPAEPVVKTADSWTDILYEPPLIDGWQLVGTSDKDAHASSWYDSRKNLITAKGDSWSLIYSSEEEPYELTYTYYQVVPAELDFRWDGSQTGENAPATDVPAEAKTINVLAGSAKTTDLPQVDGYVCSRGTQTTIKANDWVQDTDGAVYYSPYTWEDGRKIVEGTPGAVVYDANWDASNPDAPYIIDVTNATWTAGMDKDNLCKYNTSGDGNIEVYVGGDAKTGTLVKTANPWSGDTKGQVSFTIDTGSTYFREHHDEFTYTVYEERRLTGDTVYVKTTFTANLSLNPSVTVGGKNAYKVIEIKDSDITVAGTATNNKNWDENAQYSSNNDGRYRLAFETESSSWDMGYALAWTLSKEDLDVLGSPSTYGGSYQNSNGVVYASYKSITGESKRIKVSSHVFSWTNPENSDDGSTTVRAGINAIEVSGSNGLALSNTTPEFNDAAGNIDFEMWCKIGNGWVHANKTIERKDFKAKEETTENQIVATTTTYKGYYSDYSDSYDLYEVKWVDRNNNYIDYYASGDETPNNQKSTYSYAMLGANAGGVYADGKLIGEVGKVENITEGFNGGMSDVGQSTAATTYKATVSIRRGSYTGVTGNSFNFTLWNMGEGFNIGTADEPNYVIPMYEEAQDQVNRVDYYPNDFYYHYGEYNKLNKCDLVKNMTTTITATVSGDDSIASGVTEVATPTITTDSTVSRSGEFNLKLNVGDTIASAYSNENSAYTQNVKKLAYRVYVCNAEAENSTTTVNPVLEKDVYGQGYYDMYGNGNTISLEGNVMTLAGNLNMKNVTYPDDTYGSYKEQFIPGEKYKVAVVLEGNVVPEGAKSATYFTTTSYTTVTIGEKPAVVTLDDFEITNATVTKTYTDSEGNKYPELNLEWKTTFTGIDEADADSKLGFGCYGNTVYRTSNYSSADVKATVEIYDVDRGVTEDQYTISEATDQRSHTLSLTGGSYKCWFAGSSGKINDQMSGRYKVSVTYSYKTNNKYGVSETKSKTVTKVINVASQTIEDEDVLFQVDNAGSALVRVSGDRKLVRNDIKSDVNPTATIWYDGKKYDEVALASEATDGAENYKNWYAWVDLGDGHGKALDATKLKVTISGKDYDANTFDSTKKYDAVAKDFVTITKAKEKNGTFNLAYKMAIPNSSFRAVSTYWNLEGESDVEADAGAVVKTEDQKIDIYSSDVIYEGSAYKDSETGLYFGKFKSLDGKKVNVKVYNHNKDVVFTSSAVIGAEGAATATNDVVVTSATYDINGNVTLAGTFDNKAVNIKTSYNYLYVEGADGESYSTSLYESSGFAVDKDAGTFSYTGKAFTPSGNSIFGYTLREFAGLSDKNLKVSVSLNKVESDQATFTYTDGALTVSDSMIKEVTEDGADYLQVSLPRGYYANTVDIGGVIATAKEGSKGLKFASAEDDVEFTFDAATVTSMTGEGDALLSVSKYTGTMPANVTTSGLKAMAAYELGFSWSYTGNMKVRLTSEAELTEGGVPTVYYVSSDGTATEEMATTYSINQYDEVEAVFATPHNSTFVVVYKGQLDAEDYATVTFDANGGTGTMDPQVVVKGDAIELKANTFTRDGFTFAGWAESKDATVVKYADKATATFDADITLYAVWKESGSGNNEQGGGSGNNEQGGGSGQSGQGGSSQGGSSQGGNGNNGQSATDTPATVGSTVVDAATGSELVVKSDANGEESLEYKAPSTSQTVIVIPTKVKNGTKEFAVTSIAANAFKGNKTVTSVTIGENVEKIGDNAFAGCTSLKEIVVPASVDEIGTSAFEGCTGLKNATIKNGVTTIGTKAFAGCSSLTKANIPSSVKVIGEQAYAGDKKLSTASIGANVEEIKTKAFANCPKLKSLTIPKKVKKIGNQIVSGDKGLKTLTVKTKKLTTKNVSGKAFSGMSTKTVVKVPKTKKNAYTKLFRKKKLSKKNKIKAF